MMSARAQRSAKFLVIWITISYLFIIPKFLTEEWTALAFLSMLWVPQIMTNLVIRNTTLKLSFWYMVSQSGIWLLFVWETRAGDLDLSENPKQEFSESIMRLEPHPKLFLQLVGILFSQIVVIMFQQKTSASLNGNIMVRFCRRLPRTFPCRKRFLMAVMRARQRRAGYTHSYFRKFDAPTYEELPQTENSSETENYLTKDCVICISALRYLPEHLQPPSDDIELQIKEECPGYFLTPCNHAFHPDCLKRWFETKAQCPSCRT